MGGIKGINIKHWLLNEKVVNRTAFAPKPAFCGFIVALCDNVLTNVGRAHHVS
jgi:hypothetical protein